MIRLRRLENGVRVALDPMQGVRSCAIGVWIEVGSQNEQPREYGLAHFLEHMLFKGTRRRDALALADELNRLGGQVNAMTTQENICLHAHCVDEKVPRVVDLLAEMVLDSTYLQTEVRRERNVVLEEHKMYEDTPDDLVIDLFFRSLLPGSPLGRPIIGTPSTIRRFSSELVRGFVSRELHPSRVLIVLAGHFEPAAALSAARRTFGRIKANGKARRLSPIKLVNESPRQTVLKRKIEQAHFCLGSLGPGRLSPDRYAFGLLNMVLGGGMSSRLFREVREKRGLAYSIQSFLQGFRHAGVFGVAGATSPDTLDEVLKISLAEIRRMREQNIGDDELVLAKAQILDALLLSIESTSSRMARLSESILTHGRPIPYEETIRRVKAVTPVMMRRAACKYFTDAPLAGAFIGPASVGRRPLRTGALQ